MSNITSCPHCGGTRGIYIKYRQTYEQQFGWDGENFGPSEEDGPLPRIARCLDCRKQVTKQAKQIKPWNQYSVIMGRVYDMGESII